VQVVRKQELRALYDRLLEVVACHRVPERPNRVEPRVRKRRPKEYPLMTMSRQEYRNELLKLRA
jgi:hypothetical protein